MVTRLRLAVTVISLFSMLMILPSSGFGSENPEAGGTAEVAAVEAIEMLGGQVTRDDKQPGKPVVAVVFRHSQVTDAGLKQLKELKSLQALDLSGTKVTDAGLKELKELENLQTLDLSGTKFTDAGVKEIQAARPGLRIAREELRTLPALGASTVGLLGSPSGQGPLLAASALFPRRTQLSRELRERQLIEALKAIKDARIDVVPKELNELQKQLRTPPGTITPRNDVTLLGIVGTMVLTLLGIVAAALKWRWSRSPYSLEPPSADPTESGDSWRGAIMVQLVGQRCVVCMEGIRTILDGRFCRACSRAVHNSCAKSDGLPASRTHCPQCGGNPSLHLAPDFGAGGEVRERKPGRLP
jgi:hypothetical protein